MVDFIALDIETANADLGSICQIGLARFNDGKHLDSWGTLVNPEDYFDPVNITIHRINESKVYEAPKFPQIHDEIKNRLIGNVVVSHTAFDRVSLTRALQKYRLAELQCVWLDTAKVARRAWHSFAYGSYGLQNVACQLGIAFTHHNAMEDARAAGEILLRAISETGVTVEGWLNEVKRPLSFSSSKITMEGLPNGPLFGEVLVFTGTLSITRRQAAEMAAKGGCKVEASVTKSTTMLVVGDQDIRKLAGQDKSSKHRKVEELITKGHLIRIIGESDFQRLVAI